MDWGLHQLDGEYTPLGTDKLGAFQSRSVDIETKIPYDFRGRSRAPKQKAGHFGLNLSAPRETYRGSRQSSQFTEATFDLEIL